jgi:hypothetical protein
MFKDEEFPYHNWLPIISKPEPRIDICGMNSKASTFATLWLRVLGDRRSRMRCDSRLVRAAQKHAEYLSSRTGDQLLQSMHIGRNGSSSNQRARTEGYHLPDYYPVDANNIESCTRTSDKAQDALNNLLNSPHHYDHITGQGWYADHIVYGFGFSGNDWVIVIAPSE